MTWFVVKWEDGDESRRESLRSRFEAETLARIVSQTGGRKVQVTAENRQVHRYLPSVAA